MPVIAVTMSPSTVETKAQLIEALTAKAAEITGIPTQAFVVTLNELPEDALGCAGETVAKMKERLARKQ